MAMVTRSLLHPHAAEPLPLYSPQNAPNLETSSICSNAPSYISEAPSYYSSVTPADGDSITTSGSTTPTAHAVTACLYADRSSRVTVNASLVPPTTQPVSTGSSASQQTIPGLHALSRSPSRICNAESGSSPRTQSVDSLYNISSWVPATEGVQARHYQNVASRRAAQAGARNHSMLRVVAAMTAGPTTGKPTTSMLDPWKLNPESSSSDTGIAGAGAAASQPRSSSPQILHSATSIARPGNNAIMSSNLTQVIAESSASENNDIGRASDIGTVRSFPTNEPSTRASSLPRQYTKAQHHHYHHQSFHPHEDPALVGEAAAASAHSRRLYIESQGPQNLSRSAYTQTEMEQMRAQEIKTWDFMIGQMADWEEREKDWTAFRARVEGWRGDKGEKRRLFGKRWALAT